MVKNKRDERMIRRKRRTFRYVPLKESDIESGIQEAKKLATEIELVDDQIDKALEVSNRTLQRTISL